jgi:hypothetical protein
VKNFVNGYLKKKIIVCYISSENRTHYAEEPVWIGKHFLYDFIEWILFFLFLHLMKKKVTIFALAKCIDKTNKV